MKGMGSTVLVMTAALGLGCGGASLPESMATLPTEFTGPGDYTVPAVPSVQFPLSRVRIEQTAGVVSLYYDLPAALAGRSTSVELDGTMNADGTLQLSGQAGTSSCTVSPTLLRCNEDLSGIHVAQPMTSTPQDPQQAAAQAFFEDPIGVLRLPLP
jgi:hypothetical protein